MSNQYRRSSDTSNIAKRIWDNYAYIFHIIGFMIMAVFLAGGWWADNRQGVRDILNLKERMEVQEKTSVQILQSLNDIKYYLHIPGPQQSAEVDHDKRVDNAPIR